MWAAAVSSSGTHFSCSSLKLAWLLVQLDPASSMAAARLPAEQAMRSHSARYTFSGHPGLIRCLTLIVNVSTQHHIQTFKHILGDNHKITLPIAALYTCCIHEIMTDVSKQV